MVKSNKRIFIVYILSLFILLACFGCSLSKENIDSKKNVSNDNEENITETDIAGEFYCGGAEIVSGVRIRCANQNGHGRQSLRNALENSCNPALIQLSKKIGVSTFYKYAGILKSKWDIRKIIITFAENICESGEIYSIENKTTRRNE